MGGNGVGKSWNLVSWENVIAPMKYGGLAVWDMRLTNVAMLGKLVWSLIQDQSKLWVQLLWSKYLHGKHPLRPSVTGSSGASYIWKSICRALDLLWSGFQFRLDNGGILAWYEFWILQGHLCDLVPFIHNFEIDFKVSDLWNSSVCNFDSLATILPPNMVADIRQLDIPSFPRFQITGFGHLSSVYFVASAYAWLLS